MTSKILISALSVSIASSAFANDPIWDANTVNLESHQLADGVFAVVPQGAEEMAENGYPIATSGGFIIGDKGVLVIDTMPNKRLNQQLQELIRAETNLPIMFAVNTSYHGDHSYGNQYLPDSALIIQHETTAQYIHDHIDGDKAFMTKNFGEGRGIEEIEGTPADILVADKGEIDINLGNYQINIRDYGFAQTGGDLFVSIEGENILWTGNPIAAESPALPWLLDGHLVETRETLEKVLAMTDAETKIIPGHGPVTNAAAIEWAVDYLKTIETEVQIALDEGLSLEETVAKVQTPEFQGYALFGWVHPSLNVPAAYNDLSK